MNNNKKYVVVINGGSAYPTDTDFIEHLKSIDLKIERMRPVLNWKYNLQKELGDDYDVLMPRVPCSENAKYDFWKIIFDKTLEKLEGEIILIGHSLGGIFLVKYLSENIISLKVKQLHLVAAPFDNKDLKESLGEFLFNKDLLKIVTEQVDKIFIYQSKDDFVVPFSHSKEYKDNFPSSELVEFENRGHFKQESFPEIVSNITE